MRQFSRYQKIFRIATYLVICLCVMVFGYVVVRSVAKDASETAIVIVDVVQEEDELPVTVDTETIVDVADETNDVPPTGDVPTYSARNLFASASLYVDPSAPAHAQIALWSITRPADAVALNSIAMQPTAEWFGSWHSDVRASVNAYVTTVTATGALPVLVAYNIPNRDCGSHSAGGSAAADAYRLWITEFAAGIGTRSAVVILEPDATATSCVTSERLALMGEAVRLLKAQPNVGVYIDAGHANWISVATMSGRLEAANVAEADGFSLNVSSFYTTEENTAYGQAISRLVGNKHFVIDTSRNGYGSNGEWCNPLGRKIGASPTTSTGHVLIDALLWVKPPGESDGVCNGGPSAGTWWAEYALGLVQ